MASSPRPSPPEEEREQSERLGFNTMGRSPLTGFENRWGDRLL
jgi:hypothetical protein